MYDADGEVTAVIDPLGNVTTTIYDADGEVTETIDPLGHMTTTLYDADGEVTETIDPLGRMTTSLYDGDGRLVSQTWYNAQGVVVNTESFTYDADGNMLTAQNDSGTYTMTYDALNRLITTQDPFGLTLTYTYDANGNRTQVQDSLGGVTNYIYDADNELTSEQFGGTGQTPLRIDLTYDADGEILTETRYSNLAGTQVVVVSSYTYNNDGQITSLVDVNGSGNTVADFTYTYDQAGRLTSDDSLGVTTTYTYDADNELLSESSSLATIDYSYDANGNRTGGGNVVGPDNQLLSDGTWNYTYDADGNLVQEVGIATGPDAGLTWTYTYNNRNQMTSAVETQGSTTLESVTYTYDVFGNRIEEDTTSGSSTQVTRFAYDGQNIWADLDGNNNLVTRRLFLNTVNSVTARITASGTVAWYLTDRLGSVRVLTDNTGSVIDEINYDAYGNILTQTNPSASDRYLWTGEQFDAVTGLQYNQARYYDPATGRWTTEDPIGFAGGDTNLYLYVGNDPTNATDPSGLRTVEIGYFYGPKDWQNGEKPPVVTYGQIRGYPPSLSLASLFGGAGTWGQPFSTAIGSGGSLKNGDRDKIDGKEISGAKFGGAWSYIEVTGKGSAGGHCNTVTAEESESSAAGELVAEFARFKPGKYKVKVSVSYKLSKGAGTVNSNVSVLLADGAGGLKAEESLDGSTATGKTSGGGTFEVTVLVGKGGTGVVAKIIPTVAGQTGRADALGQIIIWWIERQ
ncbi:MAG: RHS repeat-associated core domain-containing protein [Isosphaeraceae bacterium]